MFRKITIAGLLVTAALWAGYDIYVAFFNSELGDTISEVVRDASTWAVGLPFAFGAICGHFYSKRKPMIVNGVVGLLLLLGFAIIVSTVSVLVRHFGGVDFGPSMAWLIAGIVGGYFLWPLGDK